MQAARHASWQAPLERLAWVAWIALIAVVTAMVLIAPEQRSVVQVYREATLAWWAGRDIYSHQVDSFNYLPSFALLFSPFALLGPPAGDLAWRWLGFGLLTAGLFRVAILLRPDASRRFLALVLLLAIPGVAGMVRNGQATVIMTALMIHAAVDVAGRRWTRAALWLGLAIAFKPLALVLALLFAALHRPLLWRSALALAVVLLVPFLHPDPGYVVDQYRDTARQFAIGGNPGIGRWADLTMMLYKFGLFVPYGVMTAVRLAAALATLALCRIALGRHAAAPAASYALALSICYLMLFNPATEENTYGALACVLAPFAAESIVAGERRWRSVALVAFCIALASDGYGTAVFRVTELWFKPLICVLFLAVLLPRLLARRPAWSDPWRPRRWTPERRPPRTAGRA
jgi:alpha-1,2-mannosyltransferase